MAKIRVQKGTVKIAKSKITKNKHLPTSKTERKPKVKKAEKPASEEIGFIPAPVFSAEPIESPDSKWIHRMKVFFPNGVKHFMRVLLAHGFYTFDDACSDYHINPEPFQMFFKSVGLPTETENTLEVIQSKLVPGFKKVENDLIEHGIAEVVTIHF